MNKITCSLVWALVLALPAGCGLSFDATAPEDFAAYEPCGGRFRAVSPDGVVYLARLEDNEPKAALSFWQEALKRRMQDAGYTFVSDGPCQIGALPGYLLELAAPVGQADYTYLLAIAVRDDEILIAQAAGEVSRLSRHKPAILEAIRRIGL